MRAILALSLCLALFVSGIGLPSQADAAVLLCPGPHTILSAEAAATGTSTSSVDLGRKYGSAAVQVDLSAAGNVYVERSLDTVTWFRPAAADATTDAMLNFEYPVGYYRIFWSGNTGTITVKIMCGASAGGRP